MESSAFHSTRQLKCPHDLIIKILLVKYILNLQRYHNKLTGLNKGLFGTLLIIHRTKTSSWRYFQRMGQTKYFVSEAFILMHGDLAGFQGYSWNLLLHCSSDLHSTSFSAFCTPQEFHAVICMRSHGGVGHCLRKILSCKSRAEHLPCFSVSTDAVAAACSHASGP